MDGSFLANFKEFLILFDFFLKILVPVIVLFHSNFGFAEGAEDVLEGEVLVVFALSCIVGVCKAPVMENVPTVKLINWVSKA
jgi:hypothetical protein